MASRAPSRASTEADASQAYAARPCLFLSHAGIDGAAAVALAERLEQSPEAQRHGLTVWVDKRALIPGTPWQDQLEAAILKRSTAFAIYLTKAGAENWVRMEVRVALDRAVGARRKGEVYPLIPIIAETALDIELLPAFARQFQGVLLADADAVQKLIGAMLDRPAATVALVDEPFRGLEAFGAKDAHLFFGRERETEELVERLKQTNFVMVVGDSGSGKSSLVKADLVPAFKEGRFAPRLGPRPDPSLWHVVEMRPLGDPFDSLIKGISNAARTLEVNADLLYGAFRRLREQDATALRDALREGAPPDAQILLVVDQFEELWTLSPDRARTAFLDGLLDVARPDDPSRRVVMTMRRDYYNLSSTHERFFRRIEDQDRQGYFNLRRMDDDALRACIERPLALAGVPAADARRLADEVLHDAGDQAGDLALIEMALTETWQERSAHRGDLLAAYVAIGRVEGAIRKAADEAYAGLGERQAMAEPLFIRLVRLGDTGGTTRRIMHADEFGSDSGLWRLAQHLGSKDGKRLLVLGRDQASETAELAHEQLVTQWPQYQRWLHGTETDPRAADKRVLDELMERATRWRDRGRKWRDLATGTDLLDFQTLARRRAPWLAPTETRFVKRSRSRVRLIAGSVVVGIVAILLTGIERFVDQQRRAQQAERQRIEALATSIGFQLELPDGKVELRDVAALIALAGASRDERLAFVDELFKRPSLAERFARNPAVVTRALVGVDPNARQEVITHAFGPASITPENPDGRYARALLGIELTAAEAVVSVLAALEETTNPDALRSLGQGLAALPVELTAEQARQAVAPVLAAIQGTTDWYAHEALGQGLAALAQKLTAEQSRQALAPILAAIKGTTDSYALSALRQGLAAFVQKLTAEQARQAVALVLGAMQGATPGYALLALGRVLAALRVELTAEQARHAVAPVLAAMQGTTDPFALRALGQGLAALPIELTVEEARQAVAPVLAAMQRTTDPSALEALSQGLAALPVELTAEQAREAVAPVLAAMQGATSPHDLEVLAKVVAALPVKLTTQQARRAVALVLAAMQEATSSYDLEALANGLAALPIELTAEQARQAAAPVLAAMQGTTNPDDLDALAKVLAALPVELTAEQAQQAVASVSAAMQAFTAFGGIPNLKALGKLDEALAALAQKLTSEQAREAVAPVLAAMQWHPFIALRVLGPGLAALAQKLSAEQARQAIESVVDGIQGTTHPYALKALGQGLAAFAQKLTAEQARQAVGRMLAAMQGTTNPFALRALGQGLAALPVELTAEQVWEAVAPVLAAMQGATSPHALNALAQGLTAFPEKLIAEQALQAVAPVLAAMQGTTDPSALEALSQGLAALPVELTAEQAREAVAPVLAAMQGATSPHDLEVLAKVVAALPIELTAEQARQTVGPVLVAIQRTTGPGSLEALSQGLAAVAEKLTAEQARQAVAPVLAAMQRTTDPSALEALSQGLALVAEMLTAEQARQAVAPVLAAIQGTTDQSALEALGWGLAAIAKKLSSEQAVQALVDSMKIPWMAGAPSDPLLTALQVRLTGAETPLVGLWDLIAQIEQRFGTAIDLTSPPKGPAQEQL